MKKTNTAALIKRFIPYFYPYRKILFFDLFCAFLTTICELVLPLIMRYLTDIGMNNLAGLTTGIVLRLGLLYLILRIVDSLANYYMSSVGHIMGARIETDMRRDAFSHLHKLSGNYFNNTKVGQIMSRLTSDLFDVTEFAHHCPEEFFIAAVKITASFIILGSINLWLTLIVFAFVPIMVLSSMRFNTKVKSAFRKQRHHIGELNAQIEDSLLGEKVVKAYANEALEERKFAQGNSLFLDIKKETYRYLAAFNATVRLFDGLMYLVLIVIGGLFMIHQRINAADLVAYMLYVTTLLSTIRRIIEFAEQFQRGMTGIERFFEIMDSTIEIFDEADAIDLTDVRGNITFEQVGFQYPDNPSHVLENINLDIKPGERLALVGPSGAGKTTLSNLVPRFYDPTSGTITIDGINIKNISLKSLRDHIGVVQQDVYLFGGSVYENIHYGRVSASEEEVWEAAKLAGADTFIQTLPQGYHTYIGERGVKLSGGQKQRLSIARMFLKNPPILILDEATSSLDNESEHLVNQSLDKLTQGRTTITIAHRLTSVQNADRILVLNHEGIVESGTHQSLMEQKGAYYQLYSSAYQSGQLI